MSVYPIIDRQNYELIITTEEEGKSYVIRDKNTHEHLPLYFNEDGLAYVIFGERGKEFLQNIVRECNARNNKRVNNRRAFEFVDEEPDDCIELEEYDGHELNGRYLWDPTNETLLLRTTRGNRLKVVHPAQSGNCLNISLCDVNGKFKSFNYRTFLKTMKEWCKDN